MVAGAVSYAMQCRRLSERKTGGLYSTCFSVEILVAYDLKRARLKSHENCFGRMKTIVKMRLSPKCLNLWFEINNTEKSSHPKSTLLGADGRGEYLTPKHITRWVKRKCPAYGDGNLAPTPLPVVSQLP